MTLYKNKYRIETTRLKNWDYSSNGYYYITICIKNREHILGKIAGTGLVETGLVETGLVETGLVETGFKPVSTMILNEYGKIVEKCWYDLSEHYSNLKLDEFVIMPNHIHGIMIIDNNDVPASVETGLKPVSTTTSSTSPSTPAKTPNKKQHGLFEFVRALKTFSSRRINEFRNSPGTPVWQSRFHDRIVRDETELNRIREYIQNNPINWKNDDLNYEKNSRSQQKMGGKGNAKDICSVIDKLKSHGKWRQSKVRKNRAIYLRDWGFGIGAPFNTLIKSGLVFRHLNFKKSISTGRP